MMEQPQKVQPTASIPAPFAAYWDYWIDTTQRTVLFWDILRQRGNSFLERETETMPTVLAYDYELILDGRDLERPTNYVLLRITPGPDHTIDPTKRPYMIIDPRAGHGPGIGGFKADSQVGVALRAGHQVYFVSFRRKPEPGQTLEDIGRAEAAFVREVVCRHPNAPKPCTIGNCQAGWAVAMLSAVSPNLMGPIVLNGAPLAYWAGVDGQNPMRYIGGLGGGSWLASFSSDLGNGTFDGANLVTNFENLNPANTLWTKLYNMYDNVDTEGPRFLSFERWWTSFFLMNQAEIEAITDNLFIGNKLATDRVTLSDGSPVRLKDIKAPIIIFASTGDNITPPQQALNWLLDVYPSDDAIVQDDQVIVYSVHKNTGHLGIFVSGSVARKEHTAIIGTLEFVDKLQPGLYEMLIEDDTGIPDEDDSILPNYQIRFFERSLDDIRAFDDGREDETAFDTFAQVSELNAQFYKTFWQPWVRLAANEQTAELARRFQPLRARYTWFSDLNPWMAPVKAWANWARENRRPRRDDNPLTEIEHEVSNQIETSLDAYRDTRDNLSAIWFKLLYGPLGIGAFVPPKHSQPATYQSAAEQAFAVQRDALLQRIDKGGFAAGVARLIVLLSRADHDIEPSTIIRSYELLPQHPRFADYDQMQIQQMLKEQFLLRYLDSDGTLAALPRLLREPHERRQALDLAKRVVFGDNQPNPAEQQVLDQIETVLGDSKSAEVTPTTIADNGQTNGLQ